MPSWKDHAKKAKAYATVGTKEIYLTDDDEKPWEHATSCEPGSSHRLGINTSVWFRAKDPKSGLTFRWTFDIEPYTANGKGHYEVDVAGCQDVMKNLRGTARKAFSDYLRACSTAVQASGAKFQQIAQRELDTAASLLAAAQES